MKSQLSPEASAHLEVLRQAILLARTISWDNLNGEKSECVADLMDAVHNIPSHIESPLNSDQDFIQMYYVAFDRKHPMSISLVNIYRGCL
ncbi:MULTISPECIES: hypothetical protein [Shewanella]|uniref:hypothetical protein n=1 Tax=Shewanella TaxID=22 RepID=UPI00118473E9|nr:MULTISPECIES: hypothetical protein [Shewanella]NMD51164.1 hypothetical protein [Shewanella sp. DNRA4]TVL30894.1 hypothetical protein AYI95_12165 [Shewanella xiamenensis]BDA62736.1 hypothetical protein NUITMVS1_41990 [Shewanella xiamenensis]